MKHQNYTPPQQTGLQLERQVILEDVKKQKMGLMPGFRFSWYHSGLEMKPEAKYSDEKLTKLFVRNIFHNIQTHISYKI